MTHAERYQKLHEVLHEYIEQHVRDLCPTATADLECNFDITNAEFEALQGQCDAIDAQIENAKKVAGTIAKAIEARETRPVKAKKHAQKRTR